jgi:hypothetical protein
MEAALGINWFRKSDPCVEMTWGQFQRYVQDSTKAAVDTTGWRFASNWRCTDGRCVDVHLAERRRGGRGIVLDAKHFRSGPLTKHEVDTTVAYRKQTRASCAVLAVSSISEVPQSVVSYIEQVGGVELLVVGENFAERLQKILSSFSG